MTTSQASPMSLALPLEIPPSPLSGFSPPRQFPHSSTRGWDDIRAALASPILLSPAPEVHLFRHGDTPTNREGLVTGASDVPLTMEGQMQAQMLGRKLAPAYDIAFCSGLIRTCHTLHIAIHQQPTRVPLVYRDVRLNERSLGELEGKPARPVEEYKQGDLLFTPPGGESYLELTRRLMNFLLDLAIWTQERRQLRILVSSHMGPLRILSAIFSGETDTRRILGTSFRNTELICTCWSRLAFPQFVELYDQQ